MSAHPPVRGTRRNPAPAFGVGAALVVLTALLGAAPARAAAVSMLPDTARATLSDGTPAFVVWPAGKKTVPAVVVAHEWWGLNAQIRGTARKLAEQGYAAIVPDFYRGRVADDAERAHELSRGVDPDTADATLAAAVAFVRAQPRVGKQRVAVLGFCMGGGLAERFALRHPDLAAAVIFYGPPDLDTADLAARRVPLQAHFGADDEGIPPPRVDALKAGLARTQAPFDVYVYTGAGHAFMNEGRPSYRPDAARQAWARALAFLEQHLKR